MNIFEIILPALIHILVKSLCHDSCLYCLKKQLMAVAGQGIVLLCEILNSRVGNPYYKDCVRPVVRLVSQEVSFDL